MRQKNETTSTVTAILTTLDTLYGTTKETFYHHQPWQLLTAIMLSAQSTDKQVDTHVFRIAKRLGWAKGKNPEAVELELQNVLPKEHWNRINFQLIYHGRAICTARNWGTFRNYDHPPNVTSCA